MPAQETTAATVSMQYVLIRYLNSYGDMHVSTKYHDRLALVQVEFHGTVYSVVTFVQDNGNLAVEIEQQNEASRWRGEFTPQCELSSGLHKQFSRPVVIFLQQSVSPESQF